MGYFKTTPGYADCPKCFGWQIRDNTPRNKQGWPLGPAQIVDCDHCGGRGEIRAGAAPAAGGWGATANPPPLPKAPPPAPTARRSAPRVVIEDAVAPPPDEPKPNPWAAISSTPVAQGWAAFKKD